MWIPLRRVSKARHPKLWWASQLFPSHHCEIVWRLIQYKKETGRDQSLQAEFCWCIHHLPITTYIDTLKRDTGAFEASEIAVLMADKRLWKDLVVARLRATKWVSEWFIIFTRCICQSWSFKHGNFHIVLYNFIPCHLVENKGQKIGGQKLNFLTFYRTITLCQRFGLTGSLQSIIAFEKIEKKLCRKRWSWSLHEW